MMTLTMKASRIVMVYAIIRSPVKDECRVFNIQCTANTSSRNTDDVSKPEI